MRPAAVRGLLPPRPRCAASGSTLAGTRTCTRRTLAVSGPAAAPRVYHYNVSTHGLLFLAATQPQNITSALKDTRFLDFFFARVRRVQQHAGADAALAQPDDGSGETYAWVSPCQGELNMLRAAATPIVYRELSDEGLLWGGTYREPFDPSALRVSAKTGYVYHPSPTPPLRSYARAVERAREEGSTPPPSPYGRYALLSSSLVLARLAHGLDLASDVRAGEEAGEIEFDGTRHRLRALEEHEVEGGM